MRRSGGNQKLSITTRGAGGTDDVEGATDVMNGQWWHLCAVIEPGVQKYFYLNGVLDASSGLSGGCSTDGSAVRVGLGYAFFNPRYHWGEMANIIFSTKNFVQADAAFFRHNPYALAWQPSRMSIFDLAGAAGSTTTTRVLKKRRRKFSTIRV